MENYVHIFGYIAGTLTTSALVPQFVKSVREKNVEGLSLTMYVFYSIGVALWLVYGFLIHNPPIIIFNIITIALALSIIVNIIKYKK